MKAEQPELLFKQPCPASTENDPLRLLVLAPFPPRLDAAHGGGRMVAQLLSQLAGRHQVGLLYLRAARELPLDPVLQAHCAWAEEVDRLETAVHPGSLPCLLRLKLQTLAGLLGSTPTWVRDWAVPAFSTRLSHIVHEWQPHIVQVEFHILGQYLHALAGWPAPVVLNQHEPGAAAAIERRRKASAMGLLFPYLESRAWQRFERTLVRQVQAVVVFTERDRQALLRLSPQARLVCISPGADLPESPLDPQGQDPPSLIFIGNYIHPPNVDAALRLAGDIFPRLSAQHPRAKLLLVGPNPPEALRRLAGGQVQVTGFVPDITPYLENAAAVAVPIRLGGGMRLKVLEALGYGKAVAASPRAVEGLAVNHREHLLLADSDADFAAALLELLDNPGLRIQLGAAARAWALENLGWERPVQAYDDLYRSLLGDAAQ
jgi:polysaccharide biosynthesis protein PslH